MGKIDYDVGDLVVCVKLRNPQKGPLREGAVYTVTALFIDDWGDMVCGLAEFPLPAGEGWYAEMFRKLPKKSQEFFAGTEQMVDA